MGIEEISGGGFGAILAKIFVSLGSSILIEAVVVPVIGGIIGLVVAAIFKPLINRKIQKIRDKINAKKKDT